MLVRTINPILNQEDLLYLRRFKFLAVPLFSRPGLTQATSSVEAAVIALSRVLSDVNPPTSWNWSLTQFRGMSNMW